MYLKSFTVEFTLIATAQKLTQSQNTTRKKIKNLCAICELDYGATLNVYQLAKLQTLERPGPGDS